MKPISFNGIKGKVYDGSTGEILSARIVVADDTGHIYGSYYTKLPGFFTEEDGSFEQLLEPGSYTMEAFHGIDYLSQKFFSV